MRLCCMRIQFAVRHSLFGLMLIITAAHSLQGGPPPKNIIIAQANSPVEISAYTARYAAGGGTYVSTGIQHSLAFSNRGSQKVVAIRFGLVSFDVFNGFIGKTGGRSEEHTSE